jgi:hypothetical protein
MSGKGFIAQEGFEVCQLCGTIDECRPYGPNDEEICFECAMKDEETTAKKMIAYITGQENDNT